MKKRIMAAVMSVIMIASAVPVSASAATSVSVGSYGNSWSSSVSCTLKNSKKDGYVKVSAPAWGQRVDIQMLNSSNRVIWSENNTLNTSCRSANITRQYKLGKGRSVYKLRFRVKGYGNSITVTKNYYNSNTK